ncbi:leucine-rich repeat-containing protein 45-like [Littorina saxatilis]|uniref:Leucine-rich repeat-containing protein 45 n=1 Tax=Littorina saxatilis TaxID=31220 RepID=A0AAN9BU32_9CAEN
MDDFRLAFLRLCKDHHIDAQDCVVEKLKSLEHTGGKGRAILDLSTQSLTPKTCAVLGKILATDRNFTELRFADCMLSEDALKNLAQGLAYNSYCKKLDLKGNNIRGAGVEALGKMVRHNKGITSICLEWNGLGMLENSFAAFCDGLAANSALRALDLRNNQINHEGAEEISTALKRNITLRALDLRWNNVGLLGGRAFIEMLKANKVLSRLELAGNNVPTDIAKAIDTAVDNNADRMTITEEHSKRTHAMSHHFKQIEKEKSLQVSDLMDQMDRKEEALRKSQRKSTQHIGHLQETLQERKGAFSSLAAKLSMTESELVLAEQKANDYGSVVNRLKQDMGDMAARHHDELRKEKEERAQMEMKYLKELSDVQEKLVTSQTRGDDLDRKCRQQQEQIFELKEQNTHLQAELKMKGSQFEERLAAEKQRHKDMLHDLESSKNKELMHFKQEAEEMERALRERIQKMESQRMELEEEISRLKSANLSDRLNAEEHLQSTKQRIKTEEEQRHRQLEERVRVLQISKDELQSHCNQQSSLVSELQSKNSGLTLEVDNLKRRLEEMGQELAGKSNYTMAEVNKVKVELNQTLSKLDGERSVHSELREKLAQIDKELSDQLLRHRQASEEKEREVVTLQEKLRARELEIQRSREEEAQRAQMLQTAIMSYVARSPK